MIPCELTAAITAAANMLASKLSDNELSLLGTVFTQLGDTLETISAGIASCGCLLYTSGAMPDGRKAGEPL